MKKVAVLVTFLLIVLQAADAQKVGLVLSGGGAKGAAHIGAMKSGLPSMQSSAFPTYWQRRMIL